MIRWPSPQPIKPIRSVLLISAPETIAGSASWEANAPPTAAVEVE